jgi:hypothetical protein
VLKRLKLLNDPSNDDPRRQHIVLVNDVDAKRALKLANSGQVLPEMSTDLEAK